MTTDRYPIVSGTSTTDPAGLEYLRLSIDQSDELVTVHYTEAELGRTLVVSVHLPEDDLSDAFYPRGEAMYMNQIVGVVLASFIGHFEGLEGKGWEYHDHSVVNNSTVALDKAKDGTLKELHEFTSRELQIVFRKPRS